MKNLLVLLLAILSLQSCNKSSNSTLRQDPIIQEIFTPNEVESLAKSLSIYQEKILTEIPGEKDFIIAYRQYLNHLSQFESVIEAYKEAKINRENYKDIYDEMIGSGLFDAFYSTDTVYLNPAEEYGIRYHVKRDGKYSQLLNALAEIDTVYYSHVESLHIVGDFMPSYIARLIHNNDEYNLADPKVQLFYILTLLKPYK